MKSVAARKTRCKCFPATNFYACMSVCVCVCVCVFMNARGEREEIGQGFQFRVRGIETCGGRRGAAGAATTDEQLLLRKPHTACILFSCGSHDIAFVLESIFFLFDTNCRCKKIVQMIPYFSSSAHRSPSLSLCVFLSLSLSLVPLLRLLRLFSVSLSARASWGSTIAISGPHLEVP